MNVACTLKTVGGAAVNAALAALSVVASGIVAVGTVVVHIFVGSVVRKSGNKMRLNAAATANTCMPSLTMPHFATPCHAMLPRSTQRHAKLM